MVNNGHDEPGANACRATRADACSTLTDNTKSIIVTTPLTVITLLLMESDFYREYFTTMGSVGMGRGL